MANIKESWKNYDALVLLLNASEAERVKFIASLRDPNKGYFISIWKDVLNNEKFPENKRRELTKLNDLLNQLLNVDADGPGEAIQFSKDLTPEFQEGRLFRLLHDSLVLDHEGPRHLNDDGRKNLKDIIKSVNAEFETYYDRDESHPLLMWNGFQNDTEFPGAGAAKTQVEPTDYGELNAKITNYYYPAGGGTPPPEDGGDGRNGERDDRDGRGDDRGGSPVAKGLWVLYLPFFLGYSSIALYYGFARNNGLLGLALVLGTAFAAVKWYNVVRFAVRGWAALLQGAWIVYLLLAGGADSFRPLAIANFVWPVGAFWLLARGLHRQKKFAAVWTGILSVVCAAAVAGVFLTPRAAEGDDWDDGLYAPPASSVPADGGNVADAGSPGAVAGGGSPLDAFPDGIPDVLNHGEDADDAAEPIPAAPPEEDEPHIEKLRRKAGGLRWDNLLPEDIEHLDAMERDSLRAQLTVLLREAGGRKSNVAVTSLEGLVPNPDPGFPWKAAVTLDRDAMCARTDDFGIGRALRLEPFLVVGPAMPSGRRLDIEFGVREGGDLAFRIGDGITGPKDAGEVVFGDAAGNLANAVAAGSAAEKGLARIRPAMARIVADKAVAGTDAAAARRFKAGNEAVADVKNGILEMCREARCRPRRECVIETLPESLELAIWRLEHPGEPTAEEKRLQSEWLAEKAGRLAEIQRIKAVQGEKTVSPWRFDSGSAARLETAVRAFESAAANDDFREAPARFSKVREAFSAFEAGCRWQSGVSRGDGYRSGAEPGRWVLEPGYEIVQGRPMKVSVCGVCNGKRSITKTYQCSTCNGAGWVPNPAAMAKNIGGLFGVKVPVNVPQNIRCTACNGRKTQSMTYPCDACGGKGKIYR